MSTAPLAAKDAELHEARAAAYGFFAAAFRYPDEAWLSQLQDPEAWSHWPTSCAPRDTALPTRAEALREQLCAAHSLESLEGDFITLFSHAVRGQCPPYELEYGHSEILQLSNLMADITAFYSAFGLETVPESHERVDHVSVESEFMAVLALKHAYATQLDDAEALAICRHAERRFLKDHLWRWYPSFAQRVGKLDDSGFYGRLVALLHRFLRAECVRLDVPVNPPLLSLRPGDPVKDSEISCGIETDCPGAADNPVVPLRIDESLRPSGVNDPHAH